MRRPLRFPADELPPVEVKIWRTAVAVALGVVMASAIVAVAALLLLRLGVFG
ncbi:MAG: hypothetical protein OXH52_22820 [Gammaproteobacteria bacterium]|nr:hypothetical protein [Gammaproteobacteria bacterium]